MSHLFGIRFVRQHFTPCMIHLSMHLFWLFRQRPASTSWTLMPVTLRWAVSGVRYRVMWSVWFLIVVVLFDPHSDGIAPLKCARFTLRTDNKSLVWLHRFKDTEGMMARWLYALQQFQFSIVHPVRPGKDHANADGLSRVPSSPCRQCTRPDCPPVVEVSECADQPFNSESTGSSEDADLVRIYIYIRGKTGSRCLMTIFPNRRLLRVIHFVYPLNRRKIRSVIVDFIGNFSDLGRGQGLMPGTTLVVASS